MLLTLLGLLTFFAPVEKTGHLIIRVDNIESLDGLIWVGLYDASNYMDRDKALVEGFEIAQTGSQLIEFEALPYGTYAIALFHDRNANGELDRNFFGIPNEPFAFSKQPKTKWRLPRFDEIQFELNQQQLNLQTELKTWWEKK